MPLPGPLALRWQRASAQGRIVFVTATVLLAVVIGYVVIWSPLQREIASAEVDLARSQALLARAQRQADESAGLARSTAANTAGVRESVDRMLVQRELRSAVTSIDAKDGRVRLVFADVRIDALVGALDGLMRDSGVRAIEATLTMRVEPGSVRADLTLSR